MFVYHQGTHGNVGVRGPLGFPGDRVSIYLKVAYIYFIKRSESISIRVVCEFRYSFTR